MRRTRSKINFDASLLDSRRDARGLLPVSNPLSAVFRFSISHRIARREKSFPNFPSRVDRRNRSAITNFQARSVRFFINFHSATVIAKFRWWNFRLNSRRLWLFFFLITCWEDEWYAKTEKIRRVSPNNKFTVYLSYGISRIEDS